jgi:hypothetical protein
MSIPAHSLSKNVSCCGKIKASTSRSYRNKGDTDHDNQLQMGWQLAGPLSLCASPGSGQLARPA